MPPDDGGLYAEFDRIVRLTPREREKALARLANEDPPLAKSVRDLLDTEEPLRWPVDESRPLESRGRWFRTFLALDGLAAAFYVFFFVTLTWHILPGLDQRGIQRVAAYVILSIVFALTAACIGYLQPGDRRVRYAYGALMAEAMCLLSAMLTRGYDQFSVLTILGFHALWVFDGLNLPLAYHFYWSYFHELGTARGARAIRWMYSWALLTIVFRWILVFGPGEMFNVSLQKTWFNTFYIGAPLLIARLVVINFRLVNDETVRRRIRLFILCSIAGVLPYGVSRALGLLLEAPSLANMRSSPLYYLIEVLVVLSIALIPLAAAHAILFRRMFGIAIRQSVLATGVLECAIALSAVGLASSLYQDRQRTVADAFRSNTTVAVLVFFLVLLWVSRPFARQWVNSHLDSDVAPKLRQCIACGKCDGVVSKRCSDCGAPLELKAIPRSLGGRYRLDRCIGQGGMGLVYEALDVELERTVAVKVLDPEKARNRPLVRRAELEALATARLSHPNIITVYDFKSADDGLVFIVMKLIHGEPLSRVIARAPMTPHAAAACFSQIFDAVEAAHGNGIVHRDLKPDNVLLEDRSDGCFHVTLLDFGIAKLRSTEGKTRVTKTGTFIGTPLYSSPEQRLSLPIDARTDIYALGVMLFEALTGQFPFAGDVEPEIAASALRNEICLDRAGDLGPALLAAIGKSLATNPDARFQDIAQLRTAVIPSLGVPAAAARG